MLDFTHDFTALLHFEEDYDANTPLGEVLPAVVAGAPQRYAGMGLRDLADEMFAQMKEANQLKWQAEACSTLPAPVFTPADTYSKLVHIEVEQVAVDMMANRTVATGVVPVSQLNLAAGLMQAFQAFLTAFGLDALLAPLAILVALGGVALLASWLIGPALGLGVVAEEGLMPPLFSRRNGKGSPTGVMILQAVIGTSSRCCTSSSPASAMPTGCSRR